MLLQECTRRLCNQLRALPSDKRSIEELRQAGEYVDLAELWVQIDTFLDELDYSEHTEVNARRIHDALMLLLCFREHPITRPTCIRLLLVPGVQLPCSLCTVPGCLGNSWSGRTAVIRHYKTSGTYGSHSITVQEGSRTELVLKEYICWARPMLLKDTSSHALFLTRYGKPFIRDGCFNKYLPRLLQSLSGAKLSWTKARAAARAAPAWRRANTHIAPSHSCDTSPPTAWCHWQLLSNWRAWLHACRRGARRGARRAPRRDADATSQRTQAHHCVPGQPPGVRGPPGA
jgi:hypothetical protein